MRRVFTIWLLACASLAAQSFEIRGTVVPAKQASVTLHGNTAPFTTSTLSDAAGNFRFTGILPGSYTIIVFVPNRGEVRKTIDVGPGFANSKGRIEIGVHLSDSKIVPDSSSVVSVRQLSIPKSAKQEYLSASKKLEKRDVEGAVAHLNKAVAIAPQFAEAWNYLGTIHYQTKRFSEAEKYFRRALEAEPEAYEPLVNLGGVLVTMEQLDEAYKYNLYAVLRRPKDALANSQLGMTYFGLGKYDLAERYLLEARRLDPGHFSHPQLLLAEIYIRRGQNAAAADQLEDFLRRHPDWPRANAVRQSISKLRTSPAI
jgi:Tfp pilus assembly protein PilF